MSINEVVFNYLLPLKPSGMTGFYYLENNNESLPPYSTIFQIDDPRDIILLCPDDQGQTRFQLDVFDFDHTTGINTREEYIALVEGLRAQVISGYSIRDSKVVNTSDRSNSINNLFQFSLEFIVQWQK